MKSCSYLLLILVFISCDVFLWDEFDQPKALELIIEHHASGSIKQELIEDSGATHVEYSNGHYLFVVKSFNGDFTGWVFSSDSTSNLTLIKFNEFYVKSASNRKAHWSEVYGSW